MLAGLKSHPRGVAGKLEAIIDDLPDDPGVLKKVPGFPVRKYFRRIAGVRPLPGDTHRILGDQAVGREQNHAVLYRLAYEESVERVLVKRR